MKVRELRAFEGFGVKVLNARERLLLGTSAHTHTHRGGRQGKMPTLPHGYSARTRLAGS